MRKLLHAAQRSARGDARSRYPLYLRGWKKIVARYPIRDRIALQLCHRSDRHHFTGSVAYFQSDDVRLVASVLSVGLDDYFVRPAQQVKIVHVLGAQIDLQRRKHVGRRDSYLLCFDTIDVRVDGRRSSVKQCERASEMWIFVRSRDKVVRRPHKSRRTEPSVVLQHHFETTGTPEALYRWRGDGQHARILDHRQACAEVRQY